MKSINTKIKGISAAPKITSVILVLDMLEASCNKFLTRKCIAIRLESEFLMKRPSTKTIFRYIQYLRDECGYPIRTSSEGYRLDWDWGRQEGFIRQELRNPRSVASLNDIKVGHGQSFPTQDALSKIIEWSVNKVKRWENATAGPYTYIIGINYRCCEMMEIILARVVYLISGVLVRTDDVSRQGRFEEQIGFLKEDNIELSKTIKSKMPSILPDGILLTQADISLLERFSGARKSLLELSTGVPSKTAEIQTKSIFLELISSLKLILASGMVKKCLLIEDRGHVSLGVE